MKTKILYIGLGLSLALNIVLLGILILKNTNENVVDQPEILEAEVIQAKAEAFLKKKVCDNLYYPNSYDPISTTVDSVCFGPLVDGKCVAAAQELIDLRQQYQSAEKKYTDAIDHIKFFGQADVGMSHYGKDRDNAKMEMEELSRKIDKRRNVIKNRDTSMDGSFYGWLVVHKFRCANGEGTVYIHSNLYVMNPEMTECYVIFSLDNDNKYNLDNIAGVINDELGIKREE